MNRRHFLYGSAAAAFLTVLPFHAYSSDGPVVKTEKGSIRGLLENGICVFRGVPCGMPPYEGKYRLALPEPVKPWAGVIDAAKPGDIPLQPGTKGGILGGGDCLRLNIWTPAPGKTKCPVMVFIPGGGSIRCDNNNIRFDGTAFARDGVVLVTANYRVNVDGFLKIKGVPANLALRDMMFALRWVQDNIAAFGGDPDNVTVFGQSAGATHITSLLSSPLSKGLFRKAILQSPAALAQYGADLASKVASSLFDFYGIEDSRDAVASLSREKLLSFPAFIAAQNKKPEWCRMLGGNIAVFKPYYDGEVLLKRPVDAIAEGAARGVEIIVGSTEEEWRWYT
ncbi:MAG: carboxylesterase family protein, partial [Mailhella sp.]